MKIRQIVFFMKCTSSCPSRPEKDMQEKFLARVTKTVFLQRYLKGRRTLYDDVQFEKGILDAFGNSLAELV